MPVQKAYHQNASAQICILRPFLNFPFIHEIFAIPKSRAVVNLLVNTLSKYIKSGKHHFLFYNTSLHGNTVIIFSEYDLTSEENKTICLDAKE
jgi:hypothetical protein